VGRTPNLKLVPHQFNIGQSTFQGIQFVLLKLVLNMFSKPNILIAICIGKLVKDKERTMKGRWGEQFLHLVKEIITN